MATGGSFSRDYELVRVAVTLVLKDESFSLPSMPARAARDSAEKLLEWSAEQQNKTAWAAFAEELVRCLNCCFCESRSGCMRSTRERMWESFFKLRSSQAFKDLWAKFLRDSIRCEPACPIFFQFITDAIMEELIRDHFPAVESSQKTTKASLDYEERNALRYTAGYVVRDLEKKIRRSAHPLKKELLLCILELLESGVEEEDDSAMWVKSVDRGRLVHVNDMLYTFFLAMELVLRRHLASHRASELSALTATKNVADDSDVKFYWSMLSASCEEDDAQILLQMIVSRWTTLRGFSFTSALMEKYKQSVRKNVQKSKGVRKQLQTPGPSTQ